MTDLPAKVGGPAQQSAREHGQQQNESEKARRQAPAFAKQDQPHQRDNTEHQRTDQGQDGARGIVNLIVQENKVRFEIDDRTAMEDGLAISSKLLSLAARVRSRS